jgi:O-antigen ligase
MGLGLTLYLLLITFSRSFWVGAFLAVIILGFFSREKIIEIIKGYRGLIWQWLKMFVLSFVVILVALNLPPQGKTSMFGDLLKNRLFDKEEALISRWQLWGPLTSEVLRNPILGSGWAQKITYKSADPRTVGDYTTYSFEWGYLDIALKIGFLGLLIYLVFLVKLLYNKQRTVFELGLILGAVAIAVTSFFSPYLNHPLGIGYLIIIGCYLNRN